MCPTPCLWYVLHILCLPDPVPVMYVLYVLCGVVCVHMETREDVIYPDLTLSALLPWDKVSPWTWSWVRGQQTQMNLLSLLSNIEITSLYGHTHWVLDMWTQVIVVYAGSALSHYVSRTVALYFILLQNFFFLTPFQEVESLNEPETNRAFDAQKSIELPHVGSRDCHRTAFVILPRFFSNTNDMIVSKQRTIS